MGLLLRLGEAARVAGVHERTIRRWAATGLLRPIKVGAESRYEPQDLAIAIELKRPRRAQTLGWVVGLGVRNEQRSLWLEDRPQSLPGARDAARNRKPFTAQSHASLAERAHLLRVGCAEFVAATSLWDGDTRKKARAEVDRVLEMQVRAGWTADRVRRLVNDILAVWRTGEARRERGGPGIRPDVGREVGPAHDGEDIEYEDSEGDEFDAEDEPEDFDGGLWLD